MQLEQRLRWTACSLAAYKVAVEEEARHICMCIACIYTYDVFMHMHMRMHMHMYMCI